MKKKAIVTGTVILVLIAAWGGFRIYLHINSIQRTSIREYALSAGPWAEQSIWESADGQAYLLSPKTSDAEYADVTAYFCFDGVWHPFQMNMTYGNTLVLENETGDVQFEGDFSIENGIFTVKDLQVTGEDSDLPKCDTYVFSEVENYDGQMSHLPFDS